MFNLYEHQKEQVDSIRQSMTRNKRVLMQAATGVGKSVMSAYMISSALKKNKTALFIVPRRQLVTQMSVTFKEFNIPHSFIVSGMPYKAGFPVYIATSGSINRRLAWFYPDVVFIDETHIGAKTLDDIITFYSKAGSWIIGLSATPTRLDGRGLDCWYDDLVCGKSIEWLIDEGFLADYKYFAPTRPDVSHVKITAGDYNKKEMAEVMSDCHVVSDIIKYQKELLGGKKSLLFGVNREHTKMLCKELNASGIKAGYMDAENTDLEISKVIRQLATGEIEVLCNVMLCTTGFDLSTAAGMDVVLDGIIDASRTASYALQKQKLGRALRRRKDGSKAIILDCAGNILNHGQPIDEIEYTLVGKKTKKSDLEEKDLAEYECIKCFFISNKKNKICPNCGFEIPKKETKKRKIKHDKEYKLVEIEREKAEKKQARMEQGKAKTLNELIAIGYKRGYKNPVSWAKYVYNGRKTKNA